MRRRTEGGPTKDRAAPATTNPRAGRGCMFIQQEKPRLTGRAKKHTEPDGVANAWLQLAKAFARHSGSGRILLLKST